MKYFDMTHRYQERCHINFAGGKSPVCYCEERIRVIGRSDHKSPGEVEVR